MTKGHDDLMSSPNTCPEFAHEARQIITDRLGSFNPKSFDHIGHEILIRNMLYQRRLQQDNVYNNPKAFEARIRKILELDHAPILRETSTRQ